MYQVSRQIKGDDAEISDKVFWGLLPRDDSPKPHLLTPQSTTKGIQTSQKKKPQNVTTLHLAPHDFSISFHSTVQIICTAAL